MKKILMIVTVLVSLILITGCGENKKEVITADEFYNRINDKYKLKDITNLTGFVKKAYLYEDENLYFYFYEGNKSFDMGNIYIDEVENISSNMMNREDDINKGINYSIMTISNDEMYYKVGFIENTLLYAKTSISDKDKVDEIFEKAGF